MLDILRTSLTDRQRAVLVGELQGVRQDDLARLLGCIRNALDRLGHDARRRLKSELGAAGFTAADLTTPGT